MIRFLLNDQLIRTPAPPGRVLADFIREDRFLKGTKIGCREGDCGACTVLVGDVTDGELNYMTVTSCLMPLINANGRHIVTVEGLNMKHLSPVQHAVVDQNGTQCGFCTVGFILSLTKFMMSGVPMTLENGLKAIDGNICRCTGYKSIERAVEGLITVLKDLKEGDRLNVLADHGYLPGYFTEVSDELSSLKSEIPESAISGNSGIIVGGGTDLYVQRSEEMPSLAIRPLFGKKGLMGISEQDGQIVIGASATVADLESSELMKSVFPDLNDFVKLVSSTPIRNMATVGGNLVNASPIGDMTIFLLALESRVVLRKGSAVRQIPLENFFLGYKKLDLDEGELLEAVTFSKPGQRFQCNFEKVSKRTHLDIATVNSACGIELGMDGKIQSIRLAAGGVSPIPLFLQRTSEFLRGKEMVSQSLVDALNILVSELSPISDVRGSVSYKKLLLRQLFLAHFIKFTGGELNIMEILEHVD